MPQHDDAREPGDLPVGQHQLRLPQHKLQRPDPGTPIHKHSRKFHDINLGFLVIRIPEDVHLT